MSDTTSAQKCIRCSYSIGHGQSFWINNDGPLCSSCAIANNLVPSFQDAELTRLRAENARLTKELSRYKAKYDALTTSVADEMLGELVDKVARLTEENAALRERLSLPGIGHDQPCYYCGKPCNALAGNPSEWPVHLTHPEEPGKVKWHHVVCVEKRLADSAGKGE